MRVLKVLPIRKARSKLSRKRTILMLQISDIRKCKGELKRLLELHKVTIADDGGERDNNIEEKDNIEEKEEEQEPSSPANEEEDDSSDVEVVYVMESGNVTM